MAVLEVQGLQERYSVTLTGERMTIGKNPDNDIVLAEDPSVSRHHALLECVGDRWSIHDRGSTNGVLVNGTRVFGEHWLRDDDELILGRTRLRFCDRANAGELTTERTGDRPKLTPKEKEVLVELCRPVLSGSAFPQPATVREIADRLFVGDAAVKQHLGHLYDKFLIAEDETVPRRVRLANAALETGTITMRDLKERPDDTAC